MGNPRRPRSARGNPQILGEKAAECQIRAVQPVLLGFDDPDQAPQLPVRAGRVSTARESSSATGIRLHVPIEIGRRPTAEGGNVRAFVSRAPARPEKSG